MTFEENGADREPPELGGFFIESSPLRPSAFKDALKTQSAPRYPEDRREA